MNARNNPQGPSKARQVDIRYVLVADTNVERAALCLKSIKPFNVGVLVARDGDEASRILERFGPPLLLIIDLSLSRKDGFAVIEGLRANRRARTEIIAWSAVREIREFATHRLAGLNVRVLRGGTAPDVVRGAIERALRSQTDSAPTADAPSPLTPEEMHRAMTALADRAREMCGTPGVAVYMRTPGAAEFRASVTWTSEDLIPNSPYYLPRVFGWIQETGEAIVLPDLTKQPLTDVPTTTLQDVVHGLVAVPILGIGDEIIGTICVFDVKPLTLKNVDVDALIALGRSVHFEPIAPPLEADEEKPDEAPAAAHVVDAALPHPSSPPRSTSPTLAAISKTPTGPESVDQPSPITGSAVVLDRTNGEFVGSRELARVRREQGRLSVVLFDVSGAREASGRSDASESLPDAIGDTLSKAIRLADLPIRWSATEILVVLPGLDGVQARGVAERVRAALQAGTNYRVSVSGGVAELGLEDTFGGIVSRAREKVKLALARGHNRVA
jgi:CheY-like chemotaxis protein/GGDEF domain-containing protein